MITEDYFEELIALLKPSSVNLSFLLKLIEEIQEIKKNNRKIIVVGNGGSAAIASHFSVDLSKNAKVRAINFNEADLITCLANDAGYEYWVKEALNIYCDEGDYVILISSSGESKNIINAAQYCINKKIKFATFTGMNKANTLSTMNKQAINIWVNSSAYNHIENVHQCWLLFVVDSCIGTAIYDARIIQ